MRLILPFCCLLLFSANPQPKTRTFHFEYSFTPTEAGSELWIPIPHTDDYQTIRDLRIVPAPLETVTGPGGNLMAHVKQTSTATIRVSFNAIRMEHLQSRLSSPSRLPSDDAPRELAQYLQPDRLVPIDGKIRQWAQEVVEQAHAHTDLEMARAIYNHVVATVKYDKTGKGWGRGDIYYACEERRGNCTDFHAIFIGYARAMGIPARFAIGFPLPADRGEGKIAGYHCWAEFYAKGIGWVPIDASEAAKNPAKREYFFGAHDENRIELSKGRDVTLAPPQKGEPLNYFVYPYLEVAGKPVPATWTEVSYKDFNPTSMR